MSRQNIDLELITKFKRGDKKAIIKIYNYYKQRITSFIRNKYPNVENCNDNVSDILLKVIEKIDKYSEEKSKFSTWVMTIAKNHMVDTFKKSEPIYTTFTCNSGDYEFGDDTTIFNCSSTNTLTITANSMYEPLSTYTTPDAQLQISDQLNYISNNMSSCDYTMFNMKASGYSYKEIGMEFNLTSSEVSNKLNYSKKKIKEKGE